MDVGIFPIGTGATADPSVLSSLARISDARGFSTLWTAGHPFRVTSLQRPYPYSESGEVPAPPTTNIYDQFTVLAYMAAITERIRLGTGVVVSPLVHPLVLAKIVASVDSLCGGRFNFGVGVGWMKEEFDVLGVPYGQRGRRTVAGLDVMKRVWSETETSMDGPDYSFGGIVSFPKPAQHPYPPIFFGGTSEHALRRVGEHGDGWFALGTSPDEVAAGRAVIEDVARRAGRGDFRLRVTVSTGGPHSQVSLDDLKRYRDAGADELLIALKPEDCADIDRALGRIADDILEPAQSL